MSAREWVPGDVLTGHVNSLFRERELFFVVEVTANSRAAWGDGLHAVNADGNGTAVGNIIDPRRVVTIDPEDREQVERLAIAFRAGSGPRSDADGMQAALRSLVTPPKPPEPLSLGAVVEDADGVLWVRVQTVDAAPWMRTNAGCDEIARPYRYYKDITAVRVLSEGVTP